MPEVADLVTRPFDVADTDLDDLSRDDDCKRPLDLSRVDRPLVDDCALVLVLSTPVFFDDRRPPRSADLDLVVELESVTLERATDRDRSRDVAAVVALVDRGFDLELLVDPEREVVLAADFTREDFVSAADLSDDRDRERLWQHPVFFFGAMMNV